MRQERGIRTWPYSRHVARLAFTPAVSSESPATRREPPAAVVRGPLFGMLTIHPGWQDPPPLLAVGDTPTALSS